MILLGGNLLIEVYEAGCLRERQIIKNRIVKSGRNALRDLVCYPRQWTPGHGLPRRMAVGTSSTAVDDTQIALVAEVFRWEFTGEPDIVVDEITFQGFLTTDDANGSGLQSLFEAGIFSDASGGPMWARATFDEIEKTPSVTVAFNWTFKLQSV